MGVFRLPIIHVWNNLTAVIYGCVTIHVSASHPRTGQPQDFFLFVPNLPAIYANNRLGINK